MRGLALSETTSDADVSMDADESHCSESLMLSSPPKAPHSRTRGPFKAASRLFADDDDEEDVLDFPKKSSILKPLDLNLALSEEDPDGRSRKSKPVDRKRNAEQRLDGRDLSFDEMESPVDMYTSPRTSPSDCYKSPLPYKAPPGTAHKSPFSVRTLDGRTVQSKNPFSPMYMEEVTPARAEAAAAAGPISDSLTFPLSFQEDEAKKKEDGEAGLPSVAPLLRHRLQKRDTLLDPATFRSVSYHYNSFTRDGYPEKKGQYSFTGSPIKETDFSNDVESNFRKIRRIKSKDDVGAASKDPAVQDSWKQKMNVNTKMNFYNRCDEISPTDVMSFPAMTSPSTPSALPPTPSKPRHYRRRQTRYTPVRNKACPQTPVPKQRRSRPFDGDDDDDLYIASPSSSSVQAPAAPQSRFYSDFDVIGELGSGSFGNVVKVLSRLDGCMYAIKVAHRPAKGNADKDRMLKEVMSKNNDSK